MIGLLVYAEQVMFLSHKNEVTIDTNPLFDLISQSPTVAMADKVGRMKAEGIPVTGLQTGDPDFSTHPRILEVAIEALRLGKTHYGQSKGSLNVRKAISKKLLDVNQIEADPDKEVLLTHGGIHAFYIGLKAILNPGDEFIVPDPTWATHKYMVKLLGGVPIPVDALPENGFLPTLKAWEKAISPRTRGIIINYPSNPTGAYPEEEYLKSLIALCRDRGLWVVSDEVYENLYYGERPVSAGSILDGKGRVLIINSLSKTYAMTGWRAGYLYAPEMVVSNAVKASQLSITCIAPFIQEAVAFTLTDPDVQLYTTHMREMYKARRQLVLDLSKQFSSSRIHISAPMGAFYYFLDMRTLGLSSDEITQRLLDEVKVGVTAGSAFGRNGEGYIRATIAASEKDIKEGFTKIYKWAGAL